MIVVCWLLGSGIGPAFMVVVQHPGGLSGDLLPQREAPLELTTKVNRQFPAPLNR